MTEVRVVLRGMDAKRWELRFLTDGNSDSERRHNIITRLNNGGYTQEQIDGAEIYIGTEYTTLLQSARSLADNE